MKTRGPQGFLVDCMGVPIGYTHTEEEAKAYKENWPFLTYHFHLVGYMDGVHLPHMSNLSEEYLNFLAHCF